MKRESDLYRPLVDGANKEGWLLYRITDLAMGRKPADIAGCSPDGRAVIVEVKRENISLNSAPFPWHLFRPHQIGWLKGYATRGALAIAIIWDIEVNLCIAYAMSSLDFDSLNETNRRSSISHCHLKLDNGNFRGWWRLLGYPSDTTEG